MVFLLKVFFLISKPSLSSSTSVGMMERRTAFLLCLSFRGFFKRTRNSSSLSTNLSSPRRRPIDSLSSASTSELPDGSGRLLRRAGAVKVRRFVLLGLQYFFTKSCLSMRRRQLYVEMASGSSPLTLLRVTLSSKFLISFSLLEEPMSVRTRLEERSIRLTECPLPKSTFTTTFSRQMLVPSSIFSKDCLYAS